jgi:hypothetical protein
MNILRRKLTLSLVLFVLIFIATFITIYAYFIRNNERGIVIVTSAYEIEIIASFDDEIVGFTSPYYDIEKQVLIVNAYDPNSDNYIGKLTIDIYITPYNTSRGRLKLMDEWELTRTYLEQDPLYPIAPVVEALNHPNMGTGYYPFSLFKTNETWHPIYDINGYAYFNMLLEKNKTTVIRLIEGGDRYITRSNEVFTESVFVYVDLRIEVVQANRFSEVWGIDPNFFNT